VVKPKALNALTNSLSLGHKEFQPIKTQRPRERTAPTSFLFFKDCLGTSWISFQSMANEGAIQQGARGVRDRPLVANVQSALERFLH
jgi:hypothetical protein